MIGQQTKPLEEVLDYLDGFDVIALFGCGGCATTFRTGGADAVESWVEILRKHGKRIATAIVLPPGVFTCYLPMSERYLTRHRSGLESADAVLNLSCGDGLQVIRAWMDEQGIVKPVVPAVNSMGNMGEGPVRFVEKCRGCGQCVLAFTAGICPFTQCPKSILNGPCGGVSEDGMCEVDGSRPCAWIQIYQRLEKLGRLDSLEQILDCHDWSGSDAPRIIDDESLKLVEKPRILRRR
ncbi:methylenetetrahydrofolate reductase C-terminal domain-containing protein [bacterium]|nr:methylenetetrahydrofolate reductase C-terminal domain-containing protein [candidate division CSSED10-310 bacterium]